MKQIIFILLATIAMTPVSAQLKNTKWEGFIRGDNPRKVVLDFKTDTLIVYSAPDEQIVETMTFSATHNTFKLVKLYGQSDCDKTSPGTYDYNIAGSKLAIKLNSDQCSDRSTAIDKTEWSRVKG